MLEVARFHIFLLGNVPKEASITQAMLEEYDLMPTLQVLVKKRATVGEWARALYLLDYFNNPHKAPSLHLAPAERYTLLKLPKRYINEHEINALLYQHVNATLALAHVALAPMFPVYEAPSLFSLMPKQPDVIKALFLEEVKNWTHETEEEVQKMAVIYGRAQKIKRI